VVRPHSVDFRHSRLSVGDYLSLLARTTSHENGRGKEGKKREGPEVLTHLEVGPKNATEANSGGSDVAEVRRRHGLVRRKGGEGKEGGPGRCRLLVICVPSSRGTLPWSSSPSKRGGGKEKRTAECECASMREMRRTACVALERNRIGKRRRGGEERREVTNQCSRVLAVYLYSIVLSVLYIRRET